MKCIYTLPIGKVREDFCKKIEEELNNFFTLPKKTLQPVDHPTYAYHSVRGQYLASKILQEIEKFLPDDGLKIIGITNVDLCTLVREFVFGVAILSGVSALVSLFRLRAEFYGFPSDEDLLLKRAIKEVNHELAHTFGLTHCSNSSCVMYFSNSINQIDTKGPNFCEACRSLIIDWFYDIIKLEGILLMANIKQVKKKVNLPRIGRISQLPKVGRITRRANCSQKQSKSYGY